MKIPGIYITLSGVIISGITSVILAYNTNIILYLFIVAGIIITLVGSYYQYKEAETVKIKIILTPDPDNPNKYIFQIPYSKYRKEHPMITMIGEQYEWCWGAPYEIDKNKTITFTFDNKLELDRYILIK